MKLSEVVGLEVVSASGDYLGHVVDLRCAGEPERGEERADRVVTEVIFGKLGWLERVGLRAVRQETVPWARVADLGAYRITLKIK
jgi:sporulation protein YlmC with PRC-barrel domain